jgi:hypothetical protein
MDHSLRFALHCRYGGSEDLFWVVRGCTEAGKFEQN